MESGGLQAISDVVLARFLSPAFRAAHPAITKRIAGMLAATDPRGYVAACTAIRDADLRAEIGSVTVPSLIIGGELDEPTPALQARELQASIRGSQLVIFPEVAHLSNIERPDAFTGLLLQFLEA